MTEPNTAYSFEDIKEILGGKDKRTVQNHIAAAGYKKKDSYSEEEVAWIREVQDIKQEQSNISYDEVKTEIEQRKADIQRQKLLGGSPSASTTHTANSNKSSSANSAVQAQPPVDTNFVGELVENIFQDQITTHMVRCVHQLPSMMNKALEKCLPELEAAANMALQQNRRHLEPMRKIEIVEEKQDSIEGETIEVDNDLNEEEQQPGQT